MTTPDTLAELEDIRAELDLGERDGRAAGARNAAELFEGPEATEHARQILSDLADGSPDLWLQCPEPHHMHGETYLDGYGSGWAAELERHARLTLALFADFETVPH
jgi:hypothetical protein